MSKNKIKLDPLLAATLKHMERNGLMDEYIETAITFDDKPEKYIKELKKEFEDFNAWGDSDGHTLGCIYCPAKYISEIAKKGYVARIEISETLEAMEDKPHYGVPISPEEWEASEKLRKEQEGD